MKDRARVLALSFLLFGAAWGRADGPGDSVVKVYASIRGPDLNRPWNKQPAFESSGSGTVIEDRQILTNAHLVLYASEIFVQGKEGGDKVEAKLKRIMPAIDLAVLTVENKDFFTGRPPLPRAKNWPQERDPVEVYGYPIGGTNQSVTKGVVSRIDYVPYSGQTQGLRVQIDAALNPGNSGGPALSGDKMIGLAFARFGLGIGANIGYIIPNEEIEAFLRDPRPRPSLLDQFQPLQNEMLRKKLQLDDKTQGLLVNRPTGPLRKFDILTHFGPHELDNQGQVKVTDSKRFPFHYVVPKLAREGTVPVTVQRDGKAVKLELPVTRGEELVLPELRGEYPEYFLYGPLVFSAATLNSAGQVFRPFNIDRNNPLLQRTIDKVHFPGEQLVLIVSPLLRHKCVRGYNDPVGRVVEEVNGIKIKNLRHLVEVLRDCQEEFVSFGFSGDNAELLVLERKEMPSVTQEVMEDNSIPRRGSPELVELWNQKRKK